MNSDNQNNPSSTEENSGAIPKRNNETSFLEDVIASSKKDESTRMETSDKDEATPTIQKPREPLTTTTILKAIGALVVVSIIFFGSFLAYIVFHPEQAYFFVNVFGINANDIATILRKLINFSFGTIIFVISIIWIIALFRTIWTPKEMKRKRLLSLMTSILIGIILFSILTFWAYLFSKLAKIDFTNLKGTILVYDASLFANPETRSLSRLSNTTNIIGPITLKFDISENARQTQLGNSVKISSYSMNFDGARCNDGTSKISGGDPTGDSSIVCIFDSVKNYNITGTYTAEDLLGKKVSIPMQMQPIEIRGVVSIKEQKNKDDHTIITIDASQLKSLGAPRWEYKDTGEVLQQDSITEEPTNRVKLIYFSIFGNGIDRIFLIQETQQKITLGDISVMQDEVNPLSYKFQVEKLGVANNSITRINWGLDDGSVLCKDSGDICEYSFNSYGKRVVRATIVLSDGKTFTIEKTLNIEEPITLIRHAVVTNKQGKILNSMNTYDVKLKSYIIQDVIPPEELTFDARDIVVENPGYRLSEVLWQFDDGKTIEEKKGERVKFSIANTLRYTVKVTYTFSKNLLTGNDIKTGKDSIIIDVERKDLIPRIKIQSDSDYVPVKILIDGSESKSENGEIIKFIYNFGDGKPDAIGDAIQEFEYTTPGSKEITLTIIDNFGNKATTKKIIVLKDRPKTINFMPSISEGVVGGTVDFTAEANGQIEDYIWAFGDNTPTLHGYTVSHVFQKPGTYMISLTVIYSDGTRKTTYKEFLVTSNE